MNALATQDAVSIFDIASKVSTPLALAGFLAACFFLILRQILKTHNLFPRLEQERGYATIVLLSAHVISLHLLPVSALGSVLRPARPETRTGRCNGGGCSGKVWRSKPGAPFLGREMPPPASPGEAPRSRATSRAKLYRKNRRWWLGQGPCLRRKAGIQLSRRM
jgi:hypothetical protein